MRISTSNTYDVSQIADTDTYQEISSFFDFFNEFTSDVVSAFNKKITLSDNISYKSIPLSLQHGVPVNIGPVNPAGVFIKSTTPVLFHNLSLNVDSTANFAVFFKDDVNTITKDAVWQAGTIVRYSVQNVSCYKVGDVVKVTNFTTQSNNGNFLVTEVDVKNGYLYVNNRLRPDATDDEAKLGFSGTPITKTDVLLGLILA